MQPADPATEHFQHWFYAAVSLSIAEAAHAFGSHETAMEHLPFLRGYFDELQQARVPTVEWWRTNLRAWEESIAAHLPLRALAAAADLDFSCLLLLITCGLVEEDVRFGILFEQLHGVSGARRPTLGLLETWWRRLDSIGARQRLRVLLDLGLLQVNNSDGPRLDCAVQVQPAIWDAVRGDTPREPAPGLRYVSGADLTPIESLVLGDEPRARVEAVVRLLRAGQAGAVVVRGPRANGRHTVVGALAHSLGRGCLIWDMASGAADQRRWLGCLATLLHAMPVLTLELGPGETAELRALRGADAPMAVVLGASGGLLGPAVQESLSITLPIPDTDTRRRHWLAAFESEMPPDQIDARCVHLRMTSGNVRRTARLASLHARLDGIPLNSTHLHEASRELGRQALLTLAEAVEVGGAWHDLAVAPETTDELLTLERRCRHREQLSSLMTAQAATANVGVRALFSGPSGTGKTLAARVLAARLGLDLYRVDLAAVVNKYIGETEKNLSQVFGRAEELNVILLLDEGDALLTGRTRVHSSNDRYANLETNYLLQRLESFAGILVVTTNASDAIDRAFERRMDMVVDFQLPGPAERWRIWQLHLPDDHSVGSTLLEDVVRRCELRGGQIRNAVLHAASLALDDNIRLSEHHLRLAVEREYRKSGAVCPLRETHAHSLVSSRSG
jgi:ATPase family associated with various cellular activities (AAA)